MAPYFCVAIKVSKQFPPFLLLTVPTSLTLSHHRVAEKTRHRCSDRQFFSLSAGVPAEGDAGNAIRGHLAGGLHRRPGHRLLAHQGPHVRWRLGGRAVPLQVSLCAPWLLWSYGLPNISI